MKHISIPCRLEQGIYKVKALRLEIAAEDSKEALKKACLMLKNDLGLKQLEGEIANLGPNHFLLILDHSEALMDLIMKYEPLPADKKRSQGKLIEATPEEALELGYPDLGK